MRRETYLQRASRKGHTMGPFTVVQRLTATHVSGTTRRIDLEESVCLRPGCACKIGIRDDQDRPFETSALDTACVRE